MVVVAAILTTAAIDSVVLFEILGFHPVQCQRGYLHFVRISLQCSLSVLSCPGTELTVFVL